MTGRYMPGGTIPRRHLGENVTQPTSLYRFYDTYGQLLYVGITRRGRGRFHDHAADKAWWAAVHTARIEHYETRQDALLAEAAAIRDEAPLHNTQHNAARTRTWPGLHDAHPDDRFGDWLEEARDIGPPISARNGIHPLPNDFTGHPVEWATLAYQIEAGWDHRPSGHDDHGFMSITDGRVVGFLTTAIRLDPHGAERRLVRHAWSAADHRRTGVASRLTDHAATHVGHGGIEGWEPPYTRDGALLVASRPASEQPDWTAAWINHTLRRPEGENT